MESRASVHRNISKNMRHLTTFDDIFLVIECQKVSSHSWTVWYMRSCLSNWGGVQNPPPNLVGVAFVVLQDVFVVDSVTYAQIAVERVSGDGFERSGAPHMPNGGSLEAKEGMTRHGNSDESPSTDAPAQVAYAQGSAASASSFSRALSSNSYEGCPRARRMISRLA